MDQFVTLVFILLTAISGVHFVVLVMSEPEQVARFPLMGLCASFIEYFFRLFWIPMAILIYMFFFNIFTALSYTCLVIGCTICFTLGVTRLGKMGKIFKETILNLREKVTRYESLAGYKFVEERKAIRCTKFERWVVGKTRAYYSVSFSVQLMCVIYFLGSSCYFLFCCCVISVCYLLSYSYFFIVCVCLCVLHSLFFISAFCLVPC
jgi:hypothetical protein